MKETEDLCQRIDALFDDFLTVDCVKTYLALSQAVFRDPKLTELKRKREEMQKSLRFLSNEKKDECIKMCKELQIAYDEDPLVVNCRSAYQEVLSLLDPISQTKL